MGVERVFLEQTLDRGFPFRADPGVCPATSARGRGRGETVDAAVLLGNGGGAVDEKDGVGAEVRGGAFQDEAVASSERSVEGEEGHAAGSHERSMGLRRGREGE